MLENRLKDAFHWLGRQFAHVKEGIDYQPQQDSQILYRKNTIEEQKLPQDPNIILRRTTTDEVIVKKDSNDQ